MLVHVVRIVSDALISWYVELVQPSCWKSECRLEIRPLIGLQTDQRVDCAAGSVSRPIQTDTVCYCILLDRSADRSSTIQ